MLSLMLFSGLLSIAILGVIKVNRKQNTHIYGYYTANNSGSITIILDEAGKVKYKTRRSAGGEIIERHSYGNGVYQHYSDSLGRTKTYKAIKDVCRVSSTDKKSWEWLDLPVESCPVAELVDKSKYSKWKKLRY